MRYYLALMPLIDQRFTRLLDSPRIMIITTVGLINHTTLSNFKILNPHLYFGLVNTDRWIDLCLWLFTGEVLWITVCQLWLKVQKWRVLIFMFSIEIFFGFQIWKVSHNLTNHMVNLFFELTKCVGRFVL